MAILAMVPLAGCLEDDQAAPMTAPNAVLESSTSETTNGQTVTFDGRNSTPSTDAATITVWHFDLGDGTNLTVNASEEAVIEHAYERGGHYVATLTITEQIGDDVATTEVASMATTIVVDEVHAVEALLTEASPLPDSQGRLYRLAFVAGATAHSLNVTLTATDQLPVGQSQLTVRILDADGEAIAIEVLDVDADDELSFLVPPAGPGEYTLEIEATSGIVDVLGTLVIDH